MCDAVSNSTCDKNTKTYCPNSVLLLLQGQTCYVITIKTYKNIINYIRSVCTYVLIYLCMYVCMYDLRLLYIFTRYKRKYILDQSVYLLYIVGFPALESYRNHHYREHKVTWLTMMDKETMSQ